MHQIVGALAPIFLLIVLGYVLRRGRFVADAFWGAAERMTYTVFFPCLLFLSLARATEDFREALPLAAAMAGAVLLICGALALSRSRWGIDGPTYAAVYQGAIRPNVYVALAAGAALFGPDGIALVAICIAAVIPLVNVLSVLVLARTGAGGRPGWMALARPIATNPLILAIALGLAVRLLGVPLPPVLTPTAEILARAALPIGLLAVGAGLEPTLLRRVNRSLLVGAAGKLLLTPAVTLALGVAFGVTGPALTMGVLFNAAPVSASAYVMTRLMGGNAPLMAALVTATTILAALTLPLLLALASLAGGGVSTGT